MLRNYKLIIAIVALGFSSLCVFAQDQVEYKDVFLDGKPAKLNVTTGEITLVKPEVKKPTQPAVRVTNEPSSNAYIVNSSDFHVVKENESLLDVSKKYGVSLAQLKQANKLESTLVNEGQTLRISNFDAVEANTVSQNTTADDYSNNEGLDYHIVSSGETLFSLAKQYGITVSQLKRLNNLNSNVIRPNQELRVREDASSEVSSSSSSFWVVQRGDNLYRIALNNGTTVEALKRLNGLKSNTIKIGQRLKLR
ncbi:MAG: LysM peptidoglycan-binding domain-containing protein [Winogradskyella sp.]|uniref:LysM peptidoglycan-binding domain-containing protein n=1 Tax=Winogradskyella sp. TaxID=1883156 RepID=UPI00385AB337